MNDLLNESTGIVWLGRNLEKLGNPDYVGTAHYRRFLDVNERDLGSDRIFCHVERQPFNVFRTYSLYHVGDDLRTFNSVFSRRHQEYARDLNDFMNGNEYAARNMFVMSRELFLEYVNFQKSCLDVLSKMAERTDFRSRDKYQKRAIGFIMERMTGFWIWRKGRSGTRIVNSDIVETSSESPYQRD